MADEIYVQIRFKAQKDNYLLSDALFYTYDEYHAKKQEEIDVDKQLRLDQFIDRIKHPPIIPEPTLQEKLTVINSQLTELINQKSTLEGKTYEVKEVTAEPVVKEVK